MLNGIKVGVISLGCDKNRVDTEKMLFNICKRHTLTNDVENAEIIIINTCAFLESARREAIEEIFTAVQYKKEGACKKIIVTGCLPQKFISEIFDELVEVDGFLGVSDYDEILSVIERVYNGERVNAVGQVKLDLSKDRVLTTKNFAYLKIADGCSNHCTYCLIPYIRGPFRSIPLECLVSEASALSGVSELILVAQDLTRYGSDFSDGTTLVTLIKRLSELDNIQKIRLLYCYPEGVTDELINQLKTNDKLIKYIDIPFQHASERILKLMNRKGSMQNNLALINKLKSEVPGIAIRSTFITGFPTEEQADFDKLVEFVTKAQMFNVGCFAYSKEKGTPAYKLPNQVPAKVKNARCKKIYAVQKKVFNAQYKKLIGLTVSVLAEGFDDEQLVYYGRAYFNAPDIDGKIYFFADDQIEYGKYYSVKLTKIDDYNFYGERQ